MPRGTPPAQPVEALERRTLLAEVVSTLGIGGTEVEIQANGQFLVASRQDDIPLLVRFNADGSTDSSFANLGVSTLGTLFDHVHDLAIQPDGKILVAGSGRSDPSPSSTADAVIVRLKADGTIDHSFGEQGIVIIDYGGIDYFSAVAIDWDGKILAATSDTATTTPASVVRFTPTGAIDTSAGPGGILSSAGQAVESIYVLPDGQVIAVGQAQGVLPDGRRIIPQYDSQIEIYNPDGTLDREAGYLIWTRPRAVATDGNHFVVAGTRETHERDYHDDGSYKHHYHPTQIVYAGDGIHGYGFRDGHAPWTDGQTSASAIAIRDGLVVATGFGVEGIPLLINRHDLPQSPFVGKPAKPGTRIEAENFDYGGQDNSFRDLDAINKGGRYRVSRVDVERSSASNGHSVGWIKAGEWLEYSIETDVPGTYRIDLSLASTTPGGKLHVEIGDDLRGPTVDVPATGARHDWQTVTAGTFRLARGTHVIRVAMDAHGQGGTVANFDWLQVTNLQQPYHTAPPTLPATIEFEDFDRGPAGVAYHDTSSGNSAGAYRQTDVDITRLADGARHAVTDVRAGEWLAYTIVVPSAGRMLPQAYDGRYYDVEMRLTAERAGGAFHIEVDGVDRTGPIVLPRAASGQFSSVRVSGLYLPAGPQVLRVVFDAPNALGVVGTFDSVTFAEARQEESDATFGTDGRATLEDGPYLRQLLAFQSDGSAILNGYHGLRRLTPDGEIDPTFAAGALVETMRNAVAVAVAPDDRIYVTGRHQDEFLVRLNPDGTPDGTFPLVTPPAAYDSPRSLAIQPDGKILLATTASAFGGSWSVRRPIVVRYLPTGQLDHSFGSLGVLALDFAPEHVESRQWIGALRAFDDGSFVVAGSADIESSPTNHGRELFASLRYAADGSPDAGYGSSGRATVRIEDVGIMKIFEDGSIAFANATHLSNADPPAVIRLDAGGTIYRPFGAAGHAAVDFFDYGEFSDLALQGQGKILVALQPTSPGRLVVIRLMPDGTLDRSFARNGALFIERPAGGARDLQVHVRPDGEVVTAFVQTEPEWRAEKRTTHVDRFVAERERRDPRFGTPFATGRRIQAEDFDHGRPGVSNHDADAEDRGGAYRVSQVDIGPTADTGGGYAVGWTEPGEWLEYTITVPRDGRYDLDVRVANPAPGARFHIEIDGADLTGPLAVPDTGSFHRSRTVTRSGIHLTQGTHVLRLAFDTAADNGAVGNFNWLRVRTTSVRPTRPSTRRAIPDIPTPPSRPPAAPASIPIDATPTPQRRRPARLAPIW